MQQLLGVTPGSVTALGLISDTQKQVNPVIDKRLMGHEVVNCHPLRNDMTTAIKPDDLVKFMKSLGYDPLIVDFSGL